MFNPWSIYLRSNLSVVVFCSWAFAEPAGWRPSRPLLSILQNRMQSAQNWCLGPLAADIRLRAAQRPLPRAPAALQSGRSDACQCPTENSAILWSIALSCYRSSVYVHSLALPASQVHNKLTDSWSTGGKNNLLSNKSWWIISQMFYTWIIPIHASICYHFHPIAGMRLIPIHATESFLRRFQRSVFFFPLYILNTLLSFAWKLRLRS